LPRHKQGTAEFVLAGNSKPGLGFHRYRASLRRSGAWPFLRTLLLVILALIVVAVVLSLIQASE
jgi:hypothetical protein